MVDKKFGPGLIKTCSYLIDENFDENFAPFSHPTYPLYLGDYKKIVEVGQGEFGVTRFDDEKPVLATFGLFQCVALAGWSSQLKIGFLTHYDSFTGLKDSFMALSKEISQQIGTEHSQFDVRAVSGEVINNRLISLSKIWLRYLECLDSKLKMNLVDHFAELSETIALDTRTGEISSYHPRFNSYRDNTRKKLVDLPTIGYTAHLAYAAKIK